MILIVGSNHDDVLYYENLLKDTYDVHILGKYDALCGSISGQEVMVLQDIYTSYVSSAIVTYIISKYYITLVINIGRVEAVTPGLRVGDIVISKNVIFGDIDQIMAVKGTELGQIPGYPRIYTVRTALLTTMNTCLENFAPGARYNSSYVSSSFFRQNKENVKPLQNDEYILSLNDNIVLDGESAGLALGCLLHDIPFIGVKIVEAKTGEYTTLDNYLKILTQYGYLGKAVASFIGEIYRTAVLRLYE